MRRVVSGRGGGLEWVRVAEVTSGTGGARPRQLRANYTHTRLGLARRTWSPSMYFTQLRVALLRLKRCTLPARERETDRKGEREREREREAGVVEGPERQRGVCVCVCECVCVCARCVRGRVCVCYAVVMSETCIRNTCLT